MKTHLVAGAFIAVTILVLGLLSEYSGYSLLIAPFGASSFLLFAYPQNPLVKTRNLIGGHLLASAVGLIFLALGSHTVLSMSMAVGAAAILMLLTDTAHPPACGNPIVIIMAKASWAFLLTPILFGVLLLVMAGMLHKKILESDNPAG